VIIQLFYITLHNLILQYRHINLIIYICIYIYIFLFHRTRLMHTSNMFLMISSVSNADNFLYIRIYIYCNGIDCFITVEPVSVYAQRTCSQTLLSRVIAIFAYRLYNTNGTWVQFECKLHQQCTSAVSIRFALKVYSNCIAVCLNHKTSALSHKPVYR